MNMKIQANKKMILASGSPRRSELLSMLGVPFDIETSDVIENNEIKAETSLIRHAENLAIKKAEAVAFRNRDAVVIGADTIVGLETQIFPKPANKQEAKLFLRQLSGKTHTVITAVAIIDEGNTHVFSKEVLVTFYELDEALIDTYLETGDSLDKAGAYGIQTEGALLVKEIKGDYYAVMGLPIASLFRHLESLEIISLLGGCLPNDD